MSQAGWSGFQMYVEKSMYMSGATPVRSPLSLGSPTRTGRPGPGPRQAQAASLGAATAAADPMPGPAAAGATVTVGCDSEPQRT